MPLAAPMMPAIAAVFFVAERHRKLPDGLLLGAVITAIMLGVPWLVTLSDKALFGVRFAQTFAPLARAPLLMPLLLSTICIVYQVLLAHLRYAVAGTAICFAAVNSFAFAYPTPLSRDAAGCVNRDAFDAIVEANQFLTRLASSREANRIIYSFAEHLTDGAGHDIFLSKVFNSVGASRFCPRMSDWVNLPRWEVREFSSLKQIAILSSLKNEEPFIQEFIGEAKRHGIPFGFTARKQFSRGRIVFTISILARMDPR